jgi:lipoprotein-releasing system ATP-binding protein
MTTVAANPIVHVQGLHKHYMLGPEDIHVLRGVDLVIDRAQWLAVLGASGSGKSTLLHLVGGLDTPDSGDVRFNDQSIFDRSAAWRDQFRNRHVGFVFQFYHLLPELNVRENVMIAGMIGQHPGNLRRRAEEVLDRVGLAERLRHRPRELSGGERQRVAIARALVNQPDLLLADEPTGNLDGATGNRILDVFAQLRDSGQTIVMVTHDPQVGERADRQLTLETGRLKA